MKLNTLYKSVVEYAEHIVAVLVRLIPTPDHTLSTQTLIVRVAVLLCDYWH